MITTAAAAAALAFGVLVFSFPSCAEEASARGLVPDDRAMTFETLEVRREGAVMFVDIAAPPMNLLGPELVRDLVALIQRAEADSAVRVLVFRSADRDY